MNFLPFVFTFLLLLTLISSFLFSSVIGTARENKIILSQHQAYLKLLSGQNKKLFELQKEKKTKEGPTKRGGKSLIPKKRKIAKEKEEGPEPRSIDDGSERSKLNLFALMQGKDPQEQHVLEQTAIRLIEILYGSCDFYNKAPMKDIAQVIVKQMMKEPIETFEEVQFNDEEFDKVYYKMLKGTNTGYPALSEYFRISKENPKPIYFRFATKSVLRAALGEDLAKTVFDLEKKNWDGNKRCQVLTKEDFTGLFNANHSAFIPQDLLGTIIDFENKITDIHQIYREGTEKIRAIHIIR